jgi:hypothetical protein
MAASNLEQRVKVLETEVERLKSVLARSVPIQESGWKRICGAFADDPAFEEAMRLGRQYRESLRPRPARGKKATHARPRHGSR